MPRRASANHAPKYREVLALHIDRLYTDVELRTRPGLRDCPVGVVENDLIVCTNDVAERILLRDRGTIPVCSLRLSRPSLRTVDVTNIFDDSEVSHESKACLNLIYVTESSIYGTASDEVRQFIRDWIVDKCAKFGCSIFLVPVEKKNTTCFFIDVTALVDGVNDIDAYRRDLSKRVPSRLLGHVKGTDGDPQARKRLLLASYLAAELRVHVYEQTKVTVSAGISCNKFLAGFARQLNKPYDQTTLYPDAAVECLSKRLLNVLPCMKQRDEQLIRAHCTVELAPKVEVPISTVAHLLKLCPPDNPAAMEKLPMLSCDKKELLDYSQGLDSTPVKNFDRDMPMSITRKQIVSGWTFSSFRREPVLKTESRNLVELLVTDAKVYHRHPKMLSVSWGVEDMHTESQTVGIPKKVRSF